MKKANEIFFIRAIDKLKLHGKMSSYIIYVRVFVCACICVRVCVTEYPKNERWGHKRPWGAVFLNYKLAERDGAVGICDFEYFVLSFFLLCLFFFTYSEALPALRLRRDDFGPPVGSALNNP